MNGFEQLKVMKVMKELLGMVKSFDITVML